MPWPEVLDGFDRFCSVNPQYDPLRQLVYDIHACAYPELHATKVMGGGLLSSPEQELHKNDNILLIRFKPKKQMFHYEHRVISGKNAFLNGSKKLSNFALVFTDTLGRSIT